jgi:ethanolamine utilization protein EutQ (cupin superfamily)
MNEQPMTLQTFDPNGVDYVDLRPALPADAALCVSAAATTGLGGGFVRLNGPMTFLVDYDEALCVLTGQLTLRRGIQEIVVSAGSAALIPAGDEVIYEPTGQVTFFFVRHPRQ